MIRTVARMSVAMERGIWGFHFRRYFITINAPWALILIDAYRVRRSRAYRRHGWQIVVHKL